MSLSWQEIYLRALVMILVCFLRTIRSFFVLSDDLKEQNVLKEPCWKLVEVALTMYVCIMNYIVIIVYYYFPGKIACFTLCILYRCQTIDMDINPKWWKIMKILKVWKKIKHFFFKCMVKSRIYYNASCKENIMHFCTFFDAKFNQSFFWKD